MYYTKTPGGCTPLFWKSLRGGPEQRVADSVCTRSFAVTEKGIYYLSSAVSQGQQISLQLLDPATGKSTTLWKSDTRLYLNQGVTVSPDGKTFLLSAETKAGADLMLVEGFR